MGEKNMKISEMELLLMKERLGISNGLAAVRIAFFAQSR
jgi:hypothetical protein